MKKILVFVLVLAAGVAALISCEKETVLTVDQSSLSFTDAGGSQTVVLTANKAWTASAGQTWCKVTPSGGEEAAGSRITIACDANTTYDERSCTVTFTCAEKTVTVAVTQATNQGLVVGQTSFELTKAAQQLEIPVQANVKFSV
ncbi:MAG: BACON domain-containing protein, partial [Bacteroidales bacterium]|nr:BACON domain-containing protein [Bacteroidales bacterium]